MPAKKRARIFIQIEVTAEQRRLFARVAEIQGTDVSHMTRVYFLREVDRMRAEGKKI